jgi:hypothetical protein
VNLEVLAVFNHLNQSDILVIEMANQAFLSIPVGEFNSSPFLNDM